MLAEYFEDENHYVLALSDEYHLFWDKCKNPLRHLDLVCCFYKCRLRFQKDPDETLDERCRERHDFACGITLDDSILCCGGKTMDVLLQVYQPAQSRTLERALGREI